MTTLAAKKPCCFQAFRWKIEAMKRKEKNLTRDEAVQKLAAITGEILSKYFPEERARKISDCREFITSLKTCD